MAPKLCVYWKELERSLKHLIAGPTPKVPDSVGEVEPEDLPF